MTREDRIRRLLHVRNEIELLIAEAIELLRADDAKDLERAREAREAELAGKASR